MLPELYQVAWKELKELMPKVNYPHDEWTEKWGDKLAQKGII